MSCIIHVEYPEQEPIPTITEKVRDTLCKYLNEKSCKDEMDKIGHIFLFDSDTSHLVPKINSERCGEKAETSRMIAIACAYEYSYESRVCVHIDLGEPVFSLIDYKFENRQQMREFFKRIIGDNNEIMCYLLLKGII